MQPTDPSKLTNQQPDADDHAPMGPPAAEVIARGYEADAYDAKSVISVPLLVVMFFVLAFGTVTVIFKFIAYPKADPRAHPVAAERNKRPLNERMAGISRTKEGDQPRLEPLRLRDNSVPTKDAKWGDMSRAITRPETAEGNSPEIHPEDLRPTKDSFPALFQTGANKLGVDKALELSDAHLGTLFKVQAKKSGPLASQHVPTASNAGRGAEESVVEVPGGAKAPEAPKHQEGKH